MLRSALSSLLGALLLLAPFTAADADVKSIPLRTHSLQQPYLDSDLQSRWWDFGGDAIVRTDSYIRLASDRPSQDGWVFSRVPLTATSWEVEIEFAITGAGHLYGDGMGIFFTKQRAQEGPVFGSQDEFEGLGVFIDTYKNNRPGTVFPYVMAMIGDGNTPYDKENDGKANELAGCSARGLRNAQHATKIKITYMAEKFLKVALVYKKEDEWTECFEMSSGSLRLPQVAYLGFSAATGELSDNFDIISVETRNLYQSASGSGSGSSSSSSSSSSRNKGSGKGALGGASKRSGSWTWTLLKLVMFGIAVGGAYVGFTLWRAQQRDRF